MTIISERLQHLRLTHGYTQTELARTMGVSRRAVYAWEHDKCPEIPRLIQLAQFYQVSTDYLLAGLFFTRYFRWLIIGLGNSGFRSALEHLGVKGI